MNNIVVKVSDKDCPVCSSMLDTETLAQRTYGTEYLTMDLDFAAMHPHIFGYISENIVDSDGDVELPIYLFFDGNDTIIGHHTGIGTQHEISPCGDPYRDVHS